VAVNYTHNWSSRLQMNTNATCCGEMSEVFSPIIHFVENGQFCLFFYHEINCVGLRLGIVTWLTTGKSGFRVLVSQEYFLFSKMSRLVFQLASYSMVTVVR